MLKKIQSKLEIGFQCLVFLPMLAAYEVVEDNDNWRHISIFNLRVNTMIMDWGTCANIISEEAVKKL